MSNKLRKQHQEIRIQKAETFQGPLPKPSDFAQYDAVLPGAAERIIAMAEKQAIHRQSLERKVIDSDAFHALVGTISGLVIGLFGLGAAGFCIIKGHDWAGVGIGWRDAGFYGECLHIRILATAARK